MQVVDPNGMPLAEAAATLLDEATWHVRSTRGLALAPAQYPNGPQG